jgi:methionyl-tRNA synthetase
MYCSGCGSKLSESSNFCTQCGKERNRVTGYSKQAWIDEDEVAREAEANAYRAKKLKQQEQQRKLLEKRRKEKAKKRQERISFLLQPKIWVSSLILLGLAAGSITMFQTQASSWTN